MAEWEAEVKIRRNGRLITRDAALGETPAAALYLAVNDLERWADDPEAVEEAVARSRGRVS